jgi:hypothetical protein
VSKPANRSISKPISKPMNKPVKADWSGAIRQALQEKQAPKTWPGAGNQPWKGAPTRKN